MRKLIGVVLLLAVLFVVWSRQRMYVRDPLGSVMRDGVKERGAQVYINYSNDVLLENFSAPMYVTVVQHGDHVGTPAEVRCVAYMVCLMDADVATLMDAKGGAKVMSMSSKELEYRDAGGRDTVVALR